MNLLAQQNKRFKYVSLGKLVDSMPKRTERLAFCRNKYLEYIRAGDRPIPYDYVVVADLDGINSCLNYESVYSCFKRDGWDVCTANQAGPYYDIWALRHELWCPGDCWAEHGFLKKQGLDANIATVASILSRQIVIPKDSPWIEVESAFGGIAIYRGDALKYGIYTGLDCRGNEICDHPTLHATLRKNGCRIFINPSFINASFTEHTIGAKDFLMRYQGKTAP